MELLIRHLARHLARRFHGSSPVYVALGVIVATGFALLFWFAALRYTDAAWMQSFTVAVGIIGAFAGALFSAKFRRAETASPFSSAVRLYRLNETLGLLLVGLAMCAVASVFPFLKDDPKHPMSGPLKVLIFSGSLGGGVGLLLYFIRQVLWIDVGERVWLVRLTGASDITDDDDYRLIVTRSGLSRLPYRLHVIRSGKTVVFKDMPLSAAENVRRAVARFRLEQRVTFAD